MFDSDRRSFQRMKLAKPILATLQGQNALILDIGMGGAFLEHRDAAMVGDKFNLSFKWKQEIVSFTCVVSRTNVIRTEGGVAVSHSGVTFTDLSDVAANRMQDMMAAFIAQMLTAQRANAAAENTEESAAILYQIGQARRSRTKGFIKYTYEKRVWTVTYTNSGTQPANGFTVAAYEDEDELEVLCRTYERADTAGRNLIRLVSELSVRSMPRKK